MIKATGGIFEVTVDGVLVYSKKATGVIPDELQLLSKICGT